MINEVNKLWAKAGNEPVGINKDEFSLFTPTLIDYKNIKQQAKKLIEYRTGIRSQKDDRSKKKFRDAFRKKFAKSFLETGKSREIEKLLKNLKDYGDNTIRYFRLARFLHIRGGGFYVDLEPRRAIELKKLLATDNAAPLEFENADQYIEYLADLKQPVLPWETKEELEKIAISLNNDVQNYIRDLESKVEKTPAFVFQNIEKLDTEKLKQYIEELRAYRRKSQELETHFESQDTSKFKNILMHSKIYISPTTRKVLNLRNYLLLRLMH